MRKPSKKEKQDLGWSFEIPYGGLIEKRGALSKKKVCDVFYGADEAFKYTWEQDKGAVDKPVWTRDQMVKYGKLSGAKFLQQLGDQKTSLIELLILIVVIVNIGLTLFGGRLGI